jgi:hypothetical protein
MRQRWTSVSLVLVAGSLVVGCGSSDPDPTGDAEAVAWVAGDLPNGFVAVSAEQDGGARRISYASRDDTNDVGDAPLRISASPTDELAASTREDATRVHVHERDGFAVSLTDEGTTYGVALVWEEAPGTWLAVAGNAPLTREDVQAVADGLRALDAAAWQRQLRALSAAARSGVDPDASEVAVAHGSIAGDAYELVALVPADYPLGSDDRRISCYRLTFRGDSSGDLCDTHPWRRRIGGQIFVFGPAGAGTTNVRIGPAEGGALDPIDVATVTAPSGPPGRFYAQAVPEGTCFVEITRPDGRVDDQLGPIGPLPSDPEHAACLAAVPGTTAVPSPGVVPTTTARAA